MTNPCTNCRRTDQGRLRYVYVSTFKGEERVAHRLRVCAKCFATLLDDVFAVAEIQDALGRWLTQEEQ